MIYTVKTRARIDDFDRFGVDDTGGMVGIYDAQDTLCALLRYA